MNTIGIDPGIHGAIGVLTDQGDFVAVYDLPVITDHSTAWIDGDALRTLLLEHGPAHVVIERVSSMPKQGVSSSFKFGCVFGSILGAVRVLQMPINLITPSTWKRAFGLSRDKRASLHRARLMFPEAELSLAKHDGRAEALLIARWFMSRVHS